MKISKVARNSAMIASFAIAVAFMSGCGGVSDAEMAQLNNLRSEVQSLQTQADSLKDERAKLEQDIAQKNAQLQQCEKQKEETRANLDKLPK